jgi:hypothetical protein
MLDHGTQVRSGQLEAGVTGMTNLSSPLASRGRLLRTGRRVRRIVRRWARGVARVLVSACLGIRQLRLEIGHPGVQKRNLILEKRNLRLQKGQIRPSQRWQAGAYVTG